MQVVAHVGVPVCLHGVCWCVCFFHTLCFSETSFPVESVSKCSLNGQT